MSLKIALTQAREKAGQATKDAREFGAQIRAVEEKNEAVPADLTEKFNKAVKDAKDEMVRASRLQSEIEMEEQQAQLSAPAERFSGRGQDRMNFDRSERAIPAGRHARMERQRLVRMQTMFSRAGVTDMQSLQRFRNEVHPEAFVGYVLGGNKGAMDVIRMHGFKPEEAMALLSTNDELGGFLTPDELRNEVIKDMAGLAVMRRICRVERTSKGALVFPTIQSATTDADMYTSGYAGAWQPEGYVTGGTAPTVQNQPKFGQNRTPVYAWAPNAVEVSQELLSDSEADIEGILGGVIAETLALDEDAGFLNGSGNNKPLGLMTATAGITEVNSGHATDVTYNGYIDVFSNLPAQYRQNARWLMNSLTLGASMKLADGNGMPLFPVNAVPGTLFGKVIEFSEFMPDRGSASTNPVIFGDFRYYVIADRQELRVQRLVERFAPNIGILPTARVGGQPLRTAAFRKMKMSA